MAEEIIDNEVSQEVAEQGRGTDTYVGHLTVGELVVPVEILSNETIQDVLSEAFQKHNLNINQYVVGDPANSINPETGNPQFFMGWVGDVVGGVFGGVGGVIDDVSDSVTGKDKEEEMRKEMEKREKEMEKKLKEHNKRVARRIEKFKLQQEKEQEKFHKEQEKKKAVLRTKGLVSEKEFKEKMSTIEMGEAAVDVAGGTSGDTAPVRYSKERWANRRKVALGGGRSSRGAGSQRRPI